MKKILLISILTSFLFGSNKEINSNDLTYIIDSTNSVCTKLSEEVKVKLFKGIKSGSIQPFKTIHNLGTMVELDINLDSEDYHIVTFSNISMCRIYQEVVLAGKYDATIIKYINN